MASSASSGYDPAFSEYKVPCTRSRSRSLLLREEGGGMRVPSYPSRTVSTEIYARSPSGSGSPTVCDGNLIPSQMQTASLSCVNSSEWLDWTTKFAVEDQVSLSPTQESPTVSEVCSLDTCKKADGVLTGCTSLDLLVKAAMQVLYCETDIREDGSLKRIHVGFGNGTSWEDCCSNGVVKKRVIRRARNVFKSPNNCYLLRKSAQTLTTKITRAAHKREVVSDGRKLSVVKDGATVMNFKKMLRSPSSKSRTCASKVVTASWNDYSVKRVKGILHGEKNDAPARDVCSSARDPEIMQRAPCADSTQIGTGQPIIRSLRGRTQILPSKFSDSVLQPWKTRTSLRAK